MKVLITILTLILPAVAYAGDYDTYQYTPRQSITIWDGGHLRALGSVNPRTGDTFIQDMDNQDIYTGHRDMNGNQVIHRYNNLSPQFETGEEGEEWPHESHDAREPWTI